MKKIILGSKSPRRRELLENIGLDFEVLTARGEEFVDLSCAFSETVRKIALQKNEQIISNNTFKESAVIICADTMVVCNGKIMGKPKNNDDARRMLNMLSGNTHQVLTGYSLYDTETKKIISDFESTDVTFKVLDEQEIENYIKTGEPMDKAGAYGIQLKASLFVEKIHGDYFNIVGLPVSKIYKLLKEEFEISLL